MRLRMYFSVIVILAIIGGVGLGMRYALSQKLGATTRVPVSEERRPEPSNVMHELIPPAGQVGAVINITPSAYQPETVRIRKGETVAFYNASTSYLQPMVRGDDALSAPGVLPAKQAWYLPIAPQGTYEVYDNIYPNLRAQIIIQ
jgi:plastocyanin